jgi:hypothetical protein
VHAQNPEKSRFLDRFGYGKKFVARKSLLTISYYLTTLAWFLIISWSRLLAQHANPPSDDTKNAYILA